MCDCACESLFERPSKVGWAHTRLDCPHCLLIELKNKK